MTLAFRTVPARLALAAALTVTAAALAVTFAQSSDARAAKVKLEGGATSLILKTKTAEALASLDVGVEGVAPAKPRKGGLAFPITGGSVDAESLAGKIRHSGGIAFVKGDTRVELTRFTINVDKKPDLTAKVGDARVSILALDLDGLKRTDKGSTVRLRGIEARLTAAAASALNDAFHTEAFKQGLKLGNARVRAVVG